MYVKKKMKKTGPKKHTEDISQQKSPPLWHALVMDMTPRRIRTSIMQDIFPPKHLTSYQDIHYQRMKSGYYVRSAKQIARHLFPVLGAEEERQESEHRRIQYVRKVLAEREAQTNPMLALQRGQVSTVMKYIPRVKTSLPKRKPETKQQTKKPYKKRSSGIYPKKSHDTAQAEPESQLNQSSADILVQPLQAPPVQNVNQPSIIPSSEPWYQSNQWLNNPLQWTNNTNPSSNVDSTNANHSSSQVATSSSNNPNQSLQVVSQQQQYHEGNQGLREWNYVMQAVTAPNTQQPQQSAIQFQLQCRQTARANLAAAMRFGHREQRVNWQRFKQLALGNAVRSMGLNYAGGGNGNLRMMNYDQRKSWMPQQYRPRNQFSAHAMSVNPRASQMLAAPSNYPPTQPPSQDTAIPTNALNYNEATSYQPNVNPFNNAAQTNSSYPIANVPQQTQALTPFMETDSVDKASNASGDVGYYARLMPDNGKVGYQEGWLANGGYDGNARKSNFHPGNNVSLSSSDEDMLKNDGSRLEDLLSTFMI